MRKKLPLPSQLHPSIPTHRIRSGTPSLHSTPSLHHITTSHHHYITALITSSVAFPNHHIALPFSSHISGCPNKSLMALTLSCHCSPCPYAIPCVPVPFPVSLRHSLCPYAIPCVPTPFLVSLCHSLCPNSVPMPFPVSLCHSLCPCAIPLAVLFVPHTHRRSFLYLKHIDA